MWRYAVFGLWFAATAVVGGALVALHASPLPAPGNHFAAVRVEDESHSWGMTHVLAPHCPCSRLVADYLIARRPASQAVELVWILGPDDSLSKRLQAAGFRVETVDPDVVAAKFGIEGGPWLLIHDEGGRVVYSGGYSATRMHVAAEAADLQVLATLQQGGTAAAWPSFGCAASKRLKQQSDPLGLKY